MNEIDKQVVMAFLERAIEQGFKLSVDNGKEATLVHQSTSITELFDACGKDGHANTFTIYDVATGAWVGVVDFSWDGHSGDITIFDLDYDVNYPTIWEKLMSPIEDLDAQLHGR